jgi:transcriptional regulator with XRE-family HTH domain
VRYSNLLLAMKRKRVTQLDLADLLRVSDASICRKLHGRAEFLPCEKTRISEQLGLDPLWLFQETVIPRAAYLPRESTMLVPAAEFRG